jgi:hypothetical protein
METSELLTCWVNGTASTRARLGALPRTPARAYAPGGSARLDGQRVGSAGPAVPLRVGPAVGARCRNAPGGEGSLASVPGPAAPLRVSDAVGAHVRQAKRDHLDDQRLRPRPTAPLMGRSARRQGGAEASGVAPWSAHPGRRRGRALS